MTIPCSTQQWSVSFLIHSHIRMCGFTAMAWRHLRDYPLPPNQLLSPPNIQPLVNDHSMQRKATKSFHSDTIRHNHMWHMYQVIDCMASADISHHPSRWHPFHVLRSEIELQPNHLVEQRRTSSHAWIQLLRHVRVFLTGRAITSTNYASEQMKMRINSKRPASKSDR